MLGVCWEDYVNRMGYTIQLALKITLFKLNESNLIQCYTSVDVLIWPYPSAGQKLLWGLGAQTRGRGGTTEAPELAPWRKSDFTDLGFGFWWGLDSRLLGINELGLKILLQSYSTLETSFFFHKFPLEFSFPLEFPQFSGWHYPPVSPEPEVLQQRSPVPWCLARPRREAPLPAPHLGCGRCGAAASGVPTVGRGLWGGRGVMVLPWFFPWFFCHFCRRLMRWRTNMNKHYGDFFCSVSESIINLPKLAGSWINYELARIVQPWSTSVVKFLWNLVDINICIYCMYIYVCIYIYMYIYIYVYYICI